MPGLLLSVVRHQILISQFMIDHLSYLTSPLSDLLAVMLVLTVRAEISDWAPPRWAGPARPGPRLMWPDLTDTRARLSGPPRQWERQWRVNMRTKFVIHRSLRGDGRSSVTRHKATNNGDVRAAQLGLSVFTCIAIGIRGQASSTSLGGKSFDFTHIATCEGGREAFRDVFSSDWRVQTCYKSPRCQNGSHPSKLYHHHSRHCIRTPLVFC